MAKKREAKRKGKKRAPRGSGKGSSFEREICRRLTEWWTGDPDRDVIFWRTAQSGGRATNRRKTKRKTAASHCGDLAAIDPCGAPLTNAIAFELKRGYSRAHLHDLLDYSDDAALQIWEEWINQARESAAAAGASYWAVIHRRDRRECLIVAPRRFHRDLDYATRAVPVAEFWVRVRSTSGPVAGDRVSLVAMSFEAFLAAVTPDAIRKLTAK